MPLKSGFFNMVLVFGSIHALVPRARATKFATVRGVSFSRSVAVMTPIEVVKIAYSPGSRAGAVAAAGAAPGAFLGAAGAVLGGGTCAQAPTPINKRTDSRFIGISILNTHSIP